MKHKEGLYFTDVGEGEISLVFLHYFGGSSNTWHKVIAELKHSFRCIAIDLPGFGNSQGIRNTLSVNDCADKIAGVIKILELKQFIIAGHSMGGKIALALASMQPPGLTSIVLIAPSPPTPEPMDDKACTELMEAYGNRSVLEKLADSITAKPLPKQDIDDVVADNLNASQTSWNWWIKQGSQEDISPQMATVEAPVLIISGKADPNFSTAFLHKEMLTHFPSASFAEVRDAGHLLPVEKPLAVSKLIQEFGAG